MDVYVDGYRSTDENWLYAHRLPASQLPPISEDQRKVATDLGVSAEDYARSLFAGNLTRSQLEDRTTLVGNLVNQWLRANRMDSEVLGIWLKTFEGKFRVEIRTSGRNRLLFVEEDIMDQVLDSGATEARLAFERVLHTNFSGIEEALAS